MKINYFRSLLILLSITYISFSQSSIPAYSANPICADSTLVCPDGGTPACTGGRVGTPVCSPSVGPSCNTGLAIFPDAVTCIFNPNNCVACTQAIPTCSQGFRLVPQTCNQCAHCEAVICTSVSCAPPPANCSYVDAPRDTNGCVTGCGMIVCNISSSSGGNVNLTCNPDQIKQEIYNRIKNYTGKPDFPDYFKVSLLDEKVGLLKGLLFQQNFDRANAIRNAIYLLVSRQINDGVISAEFKTSLDPLLLNLVNYGKICTVPTTNDECSLALQSLTSTRVSEEVDKVFKLSIIPVPLPGYDDFNPFNRLAEITNKLAIAKQRLFDLNGLAAALLRGETYDADPNTFGTQVVSGLNTPRNPNGAQDLNVVQEEILRTKAYKCQLISAEKFWRDLVNKTDCLITDPYIGLKILKIYNGEGLVLAKILGQDYDADPFTAGIQTVAEFGLNYSLNNALTYLNNARADLIFDAVCVANIPPFDNQLIIKLEDLAPAGTILSRLESNEGIISHANKFSIIPIPVTGSFSASNTISERLFEIANRISTGKTRINDLSGLLAALYAGVDYDADLNIPGNQVVSGLNTSQNPNGARDANVIFQELTRVRGYLYELNRAKEFWTSIQAKESCLNGLSTYTNVLKRNAFDYEGLLSALILGQSFDFDPNTPGIQVVPGLNTPQNPNGAENYFFVRSELIQARKDIKDLIALNCGGVIVPPDTCGSATCKNGEICITIDPCRGRPGCNVPIAQFCALPNASPFCTNGVITCMTGAPICSNNKIPVCGSSLGFSNDFSGPGCTDSSMASLSVNSAYCSTSNFRSSDENKTNCTAKKLCPSGKRFSSCREDRQACECVCSFDSRNNLGTPRCDKHNNAVCSYGLTPTCSNPNNTVSCHGKKLICTNKNDDSIDLNDKIECK